jgi:hypothetical protein
MEHAAPARGYLVGHVLGQEAWEVVRFPASAEAEEVHEIETIWGRKVFTRRQGEALHPEREAIATLIRIRRMVGEYNSRDSISKLQRRSAAA